MTRWLLVVVMGVSLSVSACGGDEPTPDDGDDTALPIPGEDDSDEADGDEADGDAADDSVETGEFRCGDRVCAATQPDGTGEYCRADGESHTCQRLPASCLGEEPGCECLSNQACGNECSESPQGHLTLRCD